MIAIAMVPVLLGLPPGGLHGGATALLLTGTCIIGVTAPKQLRDVLHDHDEDFNVHLQRSLTRSGCGHVQCRQAVSNNFAKNSNWPEALATSNSPSTVGHQSIRDLLMFTMMMLMKQNGRFNGRRWRNFPKSCTTSLDPLHEGTTVQSEQGYKGGRPD